MGSKLHFSLLVCLLSFTMASVLACEDNPEECYGQEDCGKGYICEPTYYLSGSRSGGICVKTETDEKDGGEKDASDKSEEVEGANDAAVQDSSQTSSVVEASTEASVAALDAAEDGQTADLGDAASEASVTDANVAVEGGQAQ